ncbi:MAG: GatB/YqeY domain-containing protein [Candidatus Yanofskybacteria bacterium]|nr:GatB/YqeY domain-containing protein [Candidatus Yanofskybacteria bacterium]
MLKEKIQEDLKSALKGGEQEKAGVLRMLLSSLQNRELEKRQRFAKEHADAKPEDLQEKSRLTDEEIQNAVAFEVKKRKEAQEAFLKGGRPELAEQEGREAVILQAYLPEQLSEEEVRSLAALAIKEAGAAGPKDIGNVLRILMPKVRGKAEGAEVSRIVKDLLS